MPLALKLKHFEQLVIQFGIFAVLYFFEKTEVPFTILQSHRLITGIDVFLIRY